ncbi:MAG: hypothetical protein R3F14_39630 [Polyangiaceae bacterium]
MARSARHLSPPIASSSPTTSSPSKLRLARATERARLVARILDLLEAWQRAPPHRIRVE